MSLAPGTRLGPYEILSPLGAGGMGEVYRARDTRLDRTVAVKVLPSHLSAQPEIRQRFEREAKAVSSLNHPHICTLHDIGHHEGIDYLVLEMIDGESLAARLQRGPLPTDELLRCAIQIADALEKAHKGGIVHRDLKPGNIMLTKSGAKLLDFGLARATGLATAVGSRSLSPTMSQPLTAEGTILGTFQYMAPEQLEGREADARSDIFSFGAVLYEMATGRRAFEGKSQASLISAIMGKEPPPIATLAPMAPPALERVVRQCLAKDPEERWQSAGDLRRELLWITNAGSQAGVPAPVVAKRRSKERTGWIVATVAVLAFAIVLPAAIAHLRRAPEARPLIRFTVQPPERSMLGEGLALAPDGGSIAFAAVTAGRPSLWLRSLDAVEARQISGTEEAKLPFWSPDGRRLGFFARGKLKSIDVATGSVQIICDAPEGRGGSWGRDGRILFSPGTSTAIAIVPEGGGPATPVTAIDAKARESSHRWPQLLPDGRHFLYFSRGSQRENSRTLLATLGSTETREILKGVSSVQYVAPGYLLYVRDGSLVAQPFDADRQELKGDPRVLAQQVLQYGEEGPTGYGGFSASTNGALVLESGGGAPRQLAWFDRTGTRLSEVGLPGFYDEPSLTLDAGRVAVGRAESGSGTSDIWILELARGTFSRLTFDPAADVTPVFSPRGDRVVFSSNRTGHFGLYWKLASGAGADEILVPSDVNTWPDDWSRDGRLIIFENVDPNSGSDLWLLDTTGDRKPHPYLQGPMEELHAQFSPDAKYVSYTSDESGRREVYVQTLPASGGKWQISTNGGGWGSWRADGREMYYVDAELSLMAVSVETGAEFKAGIPRKLFQLPIPISGFTNSRNEYAFTADGQKILVNAAAAESKPTPITVVLGWAQEPGLR